MVGFFCKEVRPGSRRDFLFLGRNILNSEKVNPRSEFPERTFKEERSKPAFGRQAEPLQGLTGANFINEDEKQILRAKE